MIENFRTRMGLLAGVAAALLSLGCSDDDAASSDDTIARAVQTYAQIVHASYHDSLDAAQALDEKIDAFLADPIPEGLTAAREAWIAAREPYLQTEVYRFYEGPIDDSENGVEGLVNAWPLDESYIDYTVEDAESGIVNDPSIPIEADTLIAKNEEGGEENIATGYHAIEFLLWGQDLSDDGPGDRPFTDYTTAPNADRRGQYLSTVSKLLVENLATVAEAWDEGEDNYRRAFEAASPREGLRRILTGMIVLSGFETGGERIENAIETGEQNDEHSCFSDNTHRDMIQDVQGILNVWRGSYHGGENVSGVGIRDVVAEKDPALAEELDERIEESLRLANAIEPPFDNEIQLTNAAGRARVKALAVSLREQESLLQGVFRDFGLTIPEEPQ